MITNRKVYKREWRRKRRQDPEFKAKEKAYMREYCQTEEYKKRSRLWLKNNRMKPEVRARIKAAELKRKFGITLDEYQTIFEQQNGLCQICKQTSPSKLLAVDHDHTTGKVRGLLCMNCNVVLGHLKDNKSTLRAMIEYLEKF